MRYTTADIEIDGKGIYGVVPMTPDGKDWCQDNIADEELTGDVTSTFYVESGYIQAIATGAIEDGLRVRVNGYLSRVAKHGPYAGEIVRCYPPKVRN